MFNAKKFKKEQVDVWDELADVYDQSFSALMYPAALQMIDEVGVRPGDEVLDLASGTGIDAFLAAERLGPEGSIVGADISPRMVEVANNKAQGRKLSNVSFEVMDAERLTYKDRTFDVVMSKWGLMFFPDCHRALKQALRVLRPGGRFSAMVFGRPEGTQFLTLAARAASKHLMSAVTASEGGPTDFQFGAEGALEAALNSAGFHFVRSRRFAVMITCDSAEAYWDLLIAGTGTFSYRLQRASADIREAVIRDIKQSVERYNTGDGIRLPIEVVIGYGEKPSKDVRQTAPSLPSKSVDELLSQESSDVAQVAPNEQLLSNTSQVILDVRAAHDYIHAHVPGALSAPRGRLEAAVTAMIRDAASPVVVYSDDGRAGVFACKALRDMGYRDVSNLEGGFSAWTAAGLPVEG